MSCSQQYAAKLSINAIQPTTITNVLAHGILNCGANGVSHHTPSINLNIRSSLPRFCFIKSPLLFSLDLVTYKCLGVQGFIQK